MYVEKSFVVLACLGTEYMHAKDVAKPFVPNALLNALYADVQSVQIAGMKMKGFRSASGVISLRNATDVELKRKSFISRIL
jgi:hypothetical protein